MMNLRTQRAILRRLLLVAGILFAITFALWPRPVIYRVEATDFAKKQQDLPGWNSLRQLSLPEYIQEATKDRLLEVEGQPWQDLLQRSRSVTDWLLLTPDQMPWTVEQAAQVRDFTYVRLQEGDLPMVLGITVVRPGDYTPVPAELRYPLRGKSLWILIAVVLGYALIPWSKADKTIVDYRRFRGGDFARPLGPDVPGAVLWSALADCALYLGLIQSLGSGWDGAHHDCPMADGLVWRGVGVGGGLLRGLVSQYTCREIRTQHPQRARDFFFE